MDTNIFSYLVFSIGFSDKVKYLNRNRISGVKTDWPNKAITSVVLVATSASRMSYTLFVWWIPCETFFSKVKRIKWAWSVVTFLKDFADLTCPFLCNSTHNFTYSLKNQLLTKNSILLKLLLLKKCSKIRLVPSMRVNNRYVV